MSHTKPSTRYMTTCSGRRVDVPVPKPSQVSIDDIATHLSRIPRFVGATKRFYSVAQHSIAVACLAVGFASELRLPDFHVGELISEGLAHDAPEYLTNDVPSPIKACLGGEFDLLTAEIDRSIRLALDLKEQEPKVVWLADKAILLLEAGELVPNLTVDLSYVPEKARELLRRCDSNTNGWYIMAKQMVRSDWSHDEAQRRFLEEWDHARQFAV